MGRKIFYEALLHWAEMLLIVSLVHNLNESHVNVEGEARKSESRVAKKIRLSCCQYERNLPQRVGSH